MLLLLIHQHNLWDLQVDPGLLIELEYKDLRCDLKKMDLWTFVVLIVILPLALGPLVSTCGWLCYSVTGFGFPCRGHTWGASDTSPADIVSNVIFYHLHCYCSVSGDT